MEDATFLSGRAAYQLTRTYEISAAAVYDSNRRKFQRVGADVTRLFANLSVGFGLAYNEISQETSFSFSVTPQGVQGRGARLRGLGSTNEQAQRSEIGG